MSVLCPCCKFTFFSLSFKKDARLKVSCAPVDVSLALWEDVGKTKIHTRLLPGMNEKGGGVPFTGHLRNKAGKRRQQQDFEAHFHLRKVYCKFEIFTNTNFYLTNIN